MNTHIKNLLQSALEEINEATTEVPEDEDELAETVHAVRTISDAADRLRVDSQSGPSSLPDRKSFLAGMQQQAQDQDAEESISPDDFEDTEPEQPDEDFVEEEDEDPVTEDEFFEEDEAGEDEMSQEEAQEEYDDLEIGPDPEAGEEEEIDMSEFGEDDDDLDDVESTKEVVEKEDDGDEDVSADEADEELDALWAEIAGEDQ